MTDHTPTPRTDELDALYGILVNAGSATARYRVALIAAERELAEAKRALANSTKELDEMRVEIGRLYNEEIPGLVMAEEASRKRLAEVAPYAAKQLELLDAAECFVDWYVRNAVITEPTAHVKELRERLTKAVSEMRSPAGGEATGPVEVGPEPDEYMCPNCVTPWKCNGPHLLPDVPLTVPRIPDGWHAADETPPVPKGGHRSFVIAVRRGHDGKTYTFPAVYLNAMPLEFDDDERPIEAESDADGLTLVSGWRTEMEHHSFDTAYYPLDLDHGKDVLVGWTELPQWQVVPRVEDKQPNAEQLRFMVEMLRAAKCPAPRCVGGSIISTGPDPQNDQCEWCYYRDESVKAFGNKAPEGDKP